jgi:acyl-CoA synthetase (AMP-forming)/AMP-acid ligase II
MAGSASIREWLGVLRSAGSTAGWLLRSGLLPVTPRAIVAVGSAVFRNGPSIATSVAISAARGAGTVAIVDDHGEITFGELHDRITAIAGGLTIRYGVRAGQTVAVLARNHRGFAEAVVAGARTGADVVVLSPELPAHQLRQLLERHRPAVLVHDPELVDVVRQANYEDVVLHSLGDGPQTLTELVGLGLAPRGRPGRAGRLILLTSGSTGLAKSPMRRTPAMRTVLGFALSALPAMGFRRGDIIYCGPPFSHGFGIAFLFAALATGNTLITRASFDANHMADAVLGRGVTMLPAVPTMLQRMLAAADIPEGQPWPNSVRVILTGAAPIPPHLCTVLMQSLDAGIVMGYGSSEVGPVAVATPADVAAAPGTVGRPAVGVSVRVLHADRSMASAGELGTLFVKSGMCFDGYAGDDDAAKEWVDGYLSTGDMGYLDAGGRIYIAGRADDMIVSGGENVFATEVSDVLALHPTVADVAVIGVPDLDFGQRLRAFVQLYPDVVAPTFTEFSAFLKNRLERHKMPREIVFLPEIPRNPAGKVELYRLHEYDEAGLVFAVD